MKVTFTYPLPDEPHLAWAPNSLSGLIDSDYAVRIEGRDDPVVAKVADVIMKDGRFLEMTLDFPEEDVNHLFTLFGRHPIHAKWEFRVLTENVKCLSETEDRCACGEPPMEPERLP